MRESLICIGKIGEKGYYFEDTGIQIFSYEELCYYSHFFLSVYCLKNHIRNHKCYHWHQNNNLNHIAY